MTHTNAPIAVIGCGVIGLTSAIRLQEQGFPVTIFAKATPPYTTSDVAAAYWAPGAALSGGRMKTWAVIGLTVLRELAADPTNGVFLTDLYELTMASAYWKAGKADEEAVFHLFFRSNPFRGAVQAMIIGRCHAGRPRSHRAWCGESQGRHRDGHGRCRWILMVMAISSAPLAMVAITSIRLLKRLNQCTLCRAECYLNMSKPIHSWYER